MRKTILTVIVGLASLQAATASAETLFRPRASLGFSEYELSSPESGTEISSSSYATAGAGATVAVDRVYFDVAVSTSLGATYDSGGQDEDFSRNDFAFTVGYILDGGLSIFGGVKTGQTEYTNLSLNTTSTTFDTSGVFGGLSFSFPVGGNALSLNAALALMEGTLKDDDLNLNTQFDETADTVGVSLGAAYVMNFSSGSGLMLKAAFQNYSFTDWTGNFSDQFGLSDVDESIFSADATFFVNF